MSVMDWVRGQIWCMVIPGGNEGGGSKALCKRERMDCLVYLEIMRGRSMFEQ